MAEATMRERRETRLLGALALTLAALAAWQLAGGFEEDALPPIAQAVRPPTAAGPAAAPDMRDTSAIVERPLFAQGRRRASPISAAIAAEAPVEAAPPPAPLAQKYMLVGLLVINGRPQAMLREIAGDGPTLRLRVGDPLDAWILAAIEPRKAAIFTADGGEERLRLAHPRAAIGVIDDEEDN